MTNLENVKTIHCGGMGAHAQWEQNTIRSNRLGLGQLERCNHCQKPMSEGNGWWVNYTAGGDNLLPLDLVIPQTRNDGLRRLGNECVKNFWSGVTKSDREIFFSQTQPARDDI